MQFVDKENDLELPRRQDSVGGSDVKGVPKQYLSENMG